MIRASRVVPLLTLALLGVTLRSEAQVVAVTGLPVRNAGISTGLTLGAEVGFPGADYGKGTAYGARGGVGLGPIGLSAVISKWNPKGSAPSTTAVGGYAGFKVFGGPLIPLSVTLQGGVEYAKVNAIKGYHIPIGLGIALKIPNPALAIKPWIAPRLDLSHVSTVINTNLDTHFGVSGGVDFSLLGGIGFGVAYDRVWAGNGVSPSVFSAGLNYTFKVPGL
ncbi:MAG: hypothetical protein ABI587_17840 [Gemmatimonadales bacterium]